MILVTYLLLILVTFAIGFGAQGYVNHQLNKYSHVPNTSQMTGRDVAVGMLNYYGIQGVEVRMGREGYEGALCARARGEPRLEHLDLHPARWHHPERDRPC